MTSFKITLAEGTVVIDVGSVAFQMDGKVARELGEAIFQAGCEADAVSNVQGGDYDPPD